MEFTKSLIKGKLLKRYKRFFADIKVNKNIVTVHCPNTGSMMGLLDVNNDVWISKNDNPKRKLKYTLEIIKVKNKLVGVNTHFANKIVAEGLNNKSFKEFNKLENIQSEVFYNKETRFDFLVKKKNKKIFIEVKNVTLFRNKKDSEFPDAPTSRGTKHLKTLIEASKKGFETYVLFLVQIENIKYFKIAKDLDKDYYENYIKAKKSGVQFLAYRCKIDTKQIKIDKKIKIIND
ncbi:DNA/RNA nuclease SfsA [Candidatus Pelagibacter sp.]|nr:DNA/RNA nuclease SfsA [Candidatus Pelagibacter sp.]